MDKKEKYYNFIVDDLIKNTPHSEDGVFFKPPYNRKGIPMWFVIDKRHDSHYKQFTEYVIGKYGVHTDEVSLLFRKYGNIIEK